MGPYHHGPNRAVIATQGPLMHENPSKPATNPPEFWCYLMATPLIRASHIDWGHYSYVVLPTDPATLRMARFIQEGV